MKVDEEGFMAEMKQQKAKAREAHLKKEGSAWEKDLFTGENKLFTTEFTGYEETETSANVKFIVLDAHLAQSAQMEDEIALVLDRTPFYAESGGQTGDTGVITGKNFTMQVTRLKKNCRRKDFMLEKSCGVVSW
jgi:alanyl-tRNA synthetase